MKGLLTKLEKINLLENLDLYEKWENNIKSKDPEIIEGLLTTPMRFSRFIDRSFPWNKTKEGSDFWADIYNNAQKREEEEFNLTKEEIKEKLLEKNIYSKVKVNCIKQKGKEYFEKILDSRSFWAVSDFIDRAMDWRKTNEGFEYWHKISNQLKVEEREKLDESIEETKKRQDHQEFLESLNKVGLSMTTEE